MGNMRALIEQDLTSTIEGEYGTPVVLIAPDGTKYATSKNNPSLPLMAQVLYNYTREDEGGAPVMIHEPRVSLRRTSLVRIPEPGERWAIQFAKDPAPGSTVVTYVLGKPAEGGRSIGFLVFFPTKGTNSGAPQ